MPVKTTKPPKVKTSDYPPYPLHPITDDYDDFTADELEALRRSLKKTGLIQPVVIWHDQIVDGRHRAQLCQELGIVVRYQVIHDDCTEEKMRGYVAALNEHRRARTRPLTTAEKRERIAGALEANSSLSSNALAKKLGVSDKTVTAARTLFGNPNKDRTEASGRKARGRKPAPLSPAAAAPPSASDPLPPLNLTGTPPQPNQVGNAFGHKQYCTVLDQLDIASQSVETARRAVDIALKIVKTARPSINALSINALKHMLEELLTQINIAKTDVPTHAGLDAEQVRNSITVHEGGKRDPEGGRLN
jgi:hypothetical protein